MLKINKFATTAHATALTLFILLLGVLTEAIVMLLGLENIPVGVIIWVNLPIFTISIITALKLSGIPSKHFMLSDRVSFKVVPAIFLSAAGAIILISEAGNLVYHWFPVDERFLDFFESIAMNKSAWLAAGIMAPLTEEIFFRGIILRGLQRNYPDRYAIFISAILFGMLHINVWQMIPAFLMGLFLGWIYVLTRNIWLSVIIHSIQNTLFVYIGEQNVEIQGLIYSLRAGVQFQPLWLDLTGAVLFLAGSIYIRYYYWKEQQSFLEILKKEYKNYRSNKDEEGTS